MRKQLDFYQKQAKQQGYRTRAAYKLIEIDKKFNFLAAAYSIVELGSCPGGWTQVIRHRAPQAKITSCDLLPVAPIKGVTFICGDFRMDDIRQQIISAADSIDIILSDMSPNLSGQQSRDQAAMAELVSSSLDFAHQVISSGIFVTKVFQGEESAQLIAKAKSLFTQVNTIKPSASRKHSKEVYLYMFR